jgi:hypothetical protein
MTATALHRARAELIQVKFEAARWRARCIAVAAVAALSLSLCTAQWVSAEGNHNGSGGGGGDNGGTNPGGDRINAGNPGFDYRQNWSTLERLVDRYFGPNQPVPNHTHSEPSYGSARSYGGGQAGRAGF